MECCCNSTPIPREATTIERNRILAAAKKEKERQGDNKKDYSVMTECGDRAEELGSSLFSLGLSYWTIKIVRASKYDAVGRLVRNLIRKQSQHHYVRVKCSCIKGDCRYTGSSFILDTYPGYVDLSGGKNSHDGYDELNEMPSNSEIFGSTGISSPITSVPPKNNCKRR